MQLPFDRSWREALQQLAYQATEVLCGPSASDGVSETDDTEGFIDE